MKAVEISKSKEIPQTLNGPKIKEKGKKKNKKHLSSKFCIKHESVQGLDHPSLGR